MMQMPVLKSEVPPIISTHQTNFEFETLNLEHEERSTSWKVCAVRDRQENAGKFGKAMEQIPWEYSKEAR